MWLSEGEGTEHALSIEISNAGDETKRYEAGEESIEVGLECGRVMSIESDCFTLKQGSVFGKPYYQRVGGVGLTRVHLIVRNRPTGLSLWLGLRYSAGQTNVIPTGTRPETELRPITDNHPSAGDPDGYGWAGVIHPDLGICWLKDKCDRVFVVTSPISVPFPTASRRDQSLITLYIN
ncbi:hypothetical protein BJ165DRAFT_1410210 [Panaeolus papilionaceus]|nr:hypothetical protein BJ165DRAFT_1410210 [Panaeolus papilionaceus]